MSGIRWFEAAQRPPIKQRLLLIMAAGDFPPDAQIEGQSEVEIGYWTENHFRFMRDDQIAHRVERWAMLAPCLPNDINLVRDRKLDSDVRG
jgi:hypothetical protein